MSRSSAILLAVIAIGMIGSSSAFITGCATLGSPVNGAERCATCLANYVLVNGGAACNTCPCGCSNCNSLNICEACIAGNFLFQGACLSCGVGCTQCNGATCTLCARGFNLVNNQCIECIPNCEQCNNNGVCNKCREDYVLTNNNLGQQQCVFNETRGATPGIIIWLSILFLVCCCPFITLCCCLFPPSSHVGVPSSAYIPLAPVVVPVVAKPAPVFIPGNIVTNTTQTKVITTTTQVPGKGNNILAPGTY